MHCSATTPVCCNFSSFTAACLLLANSLSACGSSDTTAPNSVVGGAATSNGGAATSNGGAATSSGGAATSNGGAATSSGGATTSNGGATTSNGGAATSNGGATTSNGGAATSNGGATTSNGGAATSSGGAATSNGGAADPCAPKTCATTANCSATKPAQELLTDFSSNSGDIKSAALEWWTQLFGGTYVYPALDACAATQPSNPITQDFSGGNWHLSGTVGTYSGFGLWFQPCMADLSGYRGISFTISGNVGATAALTMTVATAATSKASATTCSPNTATCVDTTTASCTAASKKIPVTATPTTVTVLWADLTGGIPEGTPGAAAITGIQWAPDWLWTNTSANNYPLDVVFDNLKLVL